MLLVTIESNRMLDKKHNTWRKRHFLKDLKEEMQADAHGDVCNIASVL